MNDIYKINFILIIYFSNAEIANNALDEFNIENIPAAN